MLNSASLCYQNNSFLRFIHKRWMLFLLQDLLYQRSGWGARWRSATARLSYTKQSSSSVSVLDERFCVLWRVEISAHIALFSKKIICAAKSATLLLATKTVTHRATTCMEIDSKPRTLDNTTFRSTLEASWAIMFGRLLIRRGLFMRPHRRHACRQSTSGPALACSPTSSCVLSPPRAAWPWFAPEPCCQSHASNRH